MYNFFKWFYNRIKAYKRDKFLEKLVNRGLILGKNVHIVDSFFFDPSHCFLISISDNCTICPNVRLIAHDASTKYFLGYTKIGRITIHENCFIGDSVIVLPNVSIGPNAVVGAGSVVTRDVSPGMVVAGNPAVPRGTLPDYLEKIKTKSKGKRVFDEAYYIDVMTEEKKKEMLDSCNDSIGFIV